MRQDHQRPREKAQHMSAVAEARFMLHQLALPIEPTDTIKARRERAIRKAGLSAAKGARLWYGQACALLAEEYFSLVEAVKRHALTQERAAERERAILQQLIDARQLRGTQLDLLDEKATARGSVESTDAPTDHR